MALVTRQGLADRAQPSRNPDFARLPGIQVSPPTAPGWGESAPVGVANLTPPTPARLGICWPASGHVTAGAGEHRFRGRKPGSLPALASTGSGTRETMASSSAPPATVPASTAGPGQGFGFASKTKKKHFVQQKVKVFRAADPLVGVFLWGVAHSVRPGPPPSPRWPCPNPSSSCASGYPCLQAPVSGAPRAATLPVGCPLPCSPVSRCIFSLDFFS